MHFNWRRIHRGTLAFCGCLQRNALHHEAKKDNCNDKLMSMNAFSSTDGSKINYKYTIQMREIIMHLSGRKKNKYLLIAVLLKKMMSRQLKLIAKRFNKPPLFNLHNEMPKNLSYFGFEQMSWRYCAAKSFSQSLRRSIHTLRFLCRPPLHC